MKFFKEKLIGFIVWCFYRVLSATWRVKVIEPESLRRYLKEKRIVLFAHWHGNELVLLSVVKRYRVCTMVSQSRDGEIMNTVFKLQGGFTVRGSSSRGGSSGLKSLIRNLIQKNYNASMAVDGPRGPIYQIKPGIFQLQKLLGNSSARIFAAGVSAQSVWRFEKSWNKAILPKPFSKVVIFWQEALIQLKENEDPRNPTYVQILKHALDDSQREAEKVLNLI